MSEDVTSDAASPGGQGAIATRGDLRMAAVALRDKRYNVSPLLRQKLVDKAEKILDSNDERMVLAAAKVILAADALDVKRDETELQERSQDFLETTHAIREAIKKAPVRYALAQSAEAVCGPSAPSGDTPGTPPAS